MLPKFPRLPPSNAYLHSGYYPMAMTTQHSADSRCGCYAFNVRVRGEESVARTLREKGYEVLLPSYIQKRLYSDRTRRVSCALFPGYLFAYTTLDSVMGILATPGTNYVLRSGGKIASLSAEDEKTVRALCLVNGQCEPYTNLQVGVRVLVESGPLAGLTGILMKVRNRDRVIISVESVHQSVMVEVGHASLLVLKDQPRMITVQPVAASREPA
jgi:transcriptional antiterminator NusG